MNNKGIQKLLLLLAITILLVGLASASQPTKTSTAKENKVVKEQTKTITKVITPKVTDNKEVPKKKITNNKVNQTKKSASTKTYTVSNFNTLHSALTSSKYEKVNINIKSNIKLEDNTELSDSITTLNINGNGKTIDGNKQYQFINIWGNYQSHNTINNLKIINCKAGDGGAIFNTGTLTITNCEFKNNQADHGGAIYNWEKVTVKKSTFTNNKASGDGGAIYSEALMDIRGPMKIESSIFQGNTANRGGAIFTATDNTTIKNSKFTNNKATNDGGAIYNGVIKSSSSVTTIYDRWGNAITGDTTISGLNTEIIKNTFSYNNAKHGSAVYNYVSSILIKSNTLKSNQAKTSANKAIENTAQNVKVSNNKYVTSTKHNTISNHGQYSRITSNVFDDRQNTAITIKALNTKVYLGNTVKVTLTLKTDTKKTIKNQKISVKIGSKKYTTKTNSKGTATINYKTTKTGTIKVTATYSGTKQYLKSSKNINIKVLAKK